MPRYFLRKETDGYHRAEDDGTVYLIWKRNGRVALCGFGLESILRFISDNQNDPRFKDYYREVTIEELVLTDVY